MKMKGTTLLFIALIIGKILCLILFSSEYVLRFFIPFVEHFLTHRDNAWHYFYMNNQAVEFPYNPLMLYILSFFYAPAASSTIPLIIKNMLLKLPTFFADLGIFILLTKLIPERKKLVFFAYFCSPIIIYATYIHSQLDLIPTFILLASLFLIKLRHIKISALFLGFAIGTKFHVAAAAPLICIFIFKRHGLKKAALYTLIATTVYLTLIAPFVCSAGFYHMVFLHPKQIAFFNTFISVGNLNIFVPLFVIMLLYGRFFAYKKINRDLLDAFLAITFASLVFLIPPFPGWYLWVIPFIIILLGKYSYQQPAFLVAYTLLNIFYVLFFVFFHHEGSFYELAILQKHISFIIPIPLIKNVIFTLLQATLSLVIYLVYKAGIQSNSLYKRNENIIIGLSGNSGTGKTHLMHVIKNLLGSRAGVIEGDADHRWERGDKQWQEFTHLNPKANFLHRQAEHLLYLKYGKPAWRSIYDHTNGTFLKPQKTLPRDFIILEGLHSFYLPITRKLIDIKIYLDPEERLQHHWKLVRDQVERGHSKERIFEQINRRAADGQKYIHPQKNFADMIIRFFTPDQFELGNVDISPTLHLNIALDASIKIEPLLHCALQEHLSLEWQYASDLKFQEIIIRTPPNQEILDKMSKSLFTNIDEIIDIPFTWHEGYDGFIQLIILLVISQQMKDQI